MKFATVSTNLVIGVALLLSANAFAATKANLQLGSSVLLNGTTLKPGDYKVQWEGNTGNVELTILQGKNVMAKVPAHVIELPTPSSADAAVTRKNESGPNTLSGVRFQGKKFALELGESGEAMAGSSK
jgi:hypothetical protein